MEGEPKQVLLTKELRGAEAQEVSIENSSKGASQREVVSLGVLNPGGWLC